MKEFLGLDDVVETPDWFETVFRINTGGTATTIPAVLTHDSRSAGSGKTRYIAEHLIPKYDRAIIALPTKTNMVEVVETVRGYNKSKPISVVSGSNWDEKQLRALGKVGNLDVTSKDAIVGLRRWLRGGAHGVVICTHEALVKCGDARASGGLLVVDEAVELVRLYGGMEGIQLKLDPATDIAEGWGNISGLLKGKVGKTTHKARWDALKTWIHLGGENMEVWGKTTRLPDQMKVRNIRLVVRLDALFRGWGHVHVSCANLLTTTVVGHELKTLGWKWQKITTENTPHAEAVRNLKKQTVIIPVCDNSSGHMWSKSKLDGVGSNDWNLQRACKSLKIASWKALEATSVDRLMDVDRKLGGALSTREAMEKARHEALTVPPLLQLVRSAYNGVEKMVNNGKSTGTLVFLNRDQMDNSWNNLVGDPVTMVVDADRCRRDWIDRNGSLSKIRKTLVQTYESYGSIPGALMFSNDWMKGNNLEIAPSTSVAGLNEYGHCDTIVFMAALNNSPEEADFLRTRFPGMNLQDVKLGHTLMQCCSRGSVRKGESGKPMTIIVPDVQYAELVKKHFGGTISQERFDPSWSFICNSAEDIREAEVDGGKMRRKYTEEGAVYVKRAQISIKNAGRGGKVAPKSLSNRLQCEILVAKTALTPDDFGTLLKLTKKFNEKRLKRGGNLPDPQWTIIDVPAFVDYFTNSKRWALDSDQKAFFAKIHKNPVLSDKQRGLYSYRMQNLPVKRYFDPNKDTLLERMWHRVQLERERLAK